MTRRYIPVEEAFKEWRKNPEYMTAYKALEEEFAIASARIKTRRGADIEQVIVRNNRSWA